MATSSQPEAAGEESATAAKGLGGGRSSQAKATPDARWNHQAGTMVALSEPADFIRHLAIQNQLLACLKWLSDFQVLAFIPLAVGGDDDVGGGGSSSSSRGISAEEIADLAGVPEAQLVRVVRMMATAGFLCEPRPGYVAHTALSAPFVTNLALLDAAVFLTETAAPAALQMAAATPRRRQEGENHHSYHQNQPSAYSIAASLSQSSQAHQSFDFACAEQAKLRRQWSAYRHFVAGNGDSDGDGDGDSVVRLLGRLNWNSLGRACIVDARAQSTEAAVALAGTYPLLRFIVQISDHKDGSEDAVGIVGSHEVPGGLRGRITVQRRAPEAVQPVTDATVYVLRLTSTTTTAMPAPCSPAQVAAELNAHVGALRANAAATLILTVPLLPEPGAVSSDAEAKARLGNLCCLQLTGQYGMELSELLRLVGRAGDESGRLVVASRLRCPHSDMVALGVKYQLGV